MKVYEQTVYQCAACDSITEPIVMDGLLYSRCHMDEVYFWQDNLNIGFDVS